MKALDFSWTEEIMFAVFAAFGAAVLVALQAADWAAVTDWRGLGFTLLAGGARAAFMVGAGLLLALRSRLGSIGE